MIDYSDPKRHQNKQNTDILVYNGCFRSHLKKIVFGFGNYREAGSNYLHGLDKYIFHPLGC